MQELLISINHNLYNVLFVPFYYLCQIFKNTFA